MTRRVLLIPLLALAALLYAPVAWADSYTDALVGKFSTTNHVVADPAATPPLPRPEAINAQILTTHEPIYVAVVAPNQTGVSTPDAVQQGFVARNGRFEGVILVIDSKGYHARAYNVPQSIANAVNPDITGAAKAHRGDVYGATSEFVAKMAALRAAHPGGPVTTSPAVSTRHGHDLTWLWITIGIIVAVALVIGAFFAAAALSARRRERARARDKVDSDIIAAQANVQDLADEVLAGADVSRYSDNAVLHLSNARLARREGDYISAAAHLRNLDAEVRKANRKLNPVPVPNTSALAETPPQARKAASVSAKNPAGQTVTINNNDYRTSASQGYRNYYGGGYLNGMYFYPGYYSNPFWGAGWGWSPMDVIIADELLTDHWGGNYGGGYDNVTSAQTDTSFTDTPADAGWNQDSNFTGATDSAQTDTSFDGSTSSSGSDAGFDDSSSGSDTGFGGDTYAAPSGGGWDSGGGDTDFSGSDTSFDSGGSDSFSGGGDSGF